MRDSYNSGFTIVETLLFLAITALLLLIVTVGRGAQLRQTQFTDSINSLQSKLTRLQSEINSTISNDPSATGTTLGKVSLLTEAIFTSDSSDVTIRSCKASSVDPLVSLPVVNFGVGGDCTTVETYQMKWGAKWDSTCLSLTPVGDLATGILFLRDHRNGNLKTIPYASTETNSSALTTKFNIVDNARVPIRNGYGDRCGYIDINENTSLNQLNKVFL